MSNEIRNKVAENTKLITFNLEDYYVEGNRVLVDISQWLDQGFILREKDFRTSLENHDWAQYKGSFVAIHCSTDAIIPIWAYMLFTTKVTPFANQVVLGSLEDLEVQIYQVQLSKIELSEYQGKFVIIKGCANKPVPENAYVIITQQLQSVAKSIMYGEACSSVPLFRK